MYFILDYDISRIMVNEVTLNKDPLYTYFYRHYVKQAPMTTD